MIISITDARETFELHKHALVNEKHAFYWIKTSLKLRQCYAKFT